MGNFLKSLQDERGQVELITSGVNQCTHGHLKVAPTSFDTSTSVFAPRRKVELHHLSAKARQDLEASFQGELGELHTALSNMDERICQVSDKMHTDAQARIHELYSRLEATSSE